MEYGINRHNVIIHDSIECGDKVYKTAVPIRRSYKVFDFDEFEIAKDKSRKMMTELEKVSDEISDELLVYTEAKIGDVVEVECDETTDITISWIRYADQWYINDVKYEPVE